MHYSTLLSLAVTVSTVAAQVKGFNYASTLSDGSAKDQATFEAEFAAAKALTGTSGFTSARLYTTVQGGTTSTPISAIPAAIAQGTTLLLGLWASGGQAGFTNEIAALTAAISTYGTSFTSLVEAISIGSEDLYRDSSTGQAALAGIGVGPDVIVQYIKQVKSAIANTPLASAKITHVDTYNAWTNGSNSAVIGAVDFLSMDVYPYFQSSMSNSVADGASLFQTAYDETVAVAAGKEIWVTETGWPVSGATEGLGVPSTANAQTYWRDVGCGKLFGKVNTYWYILQDALPTVPVPSFALIGPGSITAAPLFNLTCPALGASLSSVSSSTTSSSSSTMSSSSTSSAGAGIGAVGASRSTTGSSSSSGVPSGRPMVATSSISVASSTSRSVAQLSSSQTTSTSRTSTTPALRTTTSPSAAATSSASGSTVVQSTSSAEKNFAASCIFGILMTAALMTL